MTNWDHEKLYALKGKIVSDGVKAITGMQMPVFQKRRFQHGAASGRDFIRHFPEKDIAYRKEFLSSYE
jgi:asparagine synthase (glutamine-hydrolysing)